MIIDYLLFEIYVLVI